MTQSDFTLSPNLPPGHHIVRRSVDPKTGWVNLSFTPHVKGQKAITASAPLSSRDRPKSEPKLGPLTVRIPNRFMPPSYWTPDALEDLVASVHAGVEDPVQMRSQQLTTLTTLINRVHTTAGERRRFAVARLKKKVRKGGDGVLKVPPTHEEREKIRKKNPGVKVFAVQSPLLTPPWWI